MSIENEELALENRSSIQISKELRNELKRLGIKGESYEDVLWRLVQKSKVPGGLWKRKDILKLKEGEWIIDTFSGNMHDLDAELDIEQQDENAEINTQEVRSILTGIRQLCDQLDEEMPALLKKENKGKSQK
jgi:hypothetical protein